MAPLFKIWLLGVMRYGLLEKIREFTRRLTNNGNNIQVQLSEFLLMEVEFLILSIQAIISKNGTRNQKIGLIYKVLMLRILE